jgi:hypothetical protein
MVSLGPHFFALSANEGMGPTLSVLASVGLIGSCAAACIDINRVTTKADLINNWYENRRGIDGAKLQTTNLPHKDKESGPYAVLKM